MKILPVLLLSLLCLQGCFWRINPLKPIKQVPKAVKPLAVPLMMVSQSKPMQAAGVLADTAVRSYLKDEGMGLSGYTWKSKNFTLKIGEISTELAHDQADYRASLGQGPDQFWNDECWEESRFGFRILFRF